MSDDAPLGLDDEALATHRTVYAADAMQDKIMVVSGAAGGLGRAIAWLLARLGAHVVLVGRDREKLDALTAALQARGLAASCYAADIRDADAVQALFDTIWRDRGRGRWPRQFGRRTNFRKPRSTSRRKAGTPSSPPISPAHGS